MASTELNSVDPQTKTTSFRPNPEYHHGVGDDDNNNNNNNKNNNNNNNNKKDTPLPNFNIDTQNDGFNMYLSLYQIWFLLSVSMLNFKGVCDVKMLLLLNYSSTSIHMYPGCGNFSESLYEYFLGYYRISKNRLLNGACLLACKFMARKSWTYGRNSMISADGILSIASFTRICLRYHSNIKLSNSHLWSRLVAAPHWAGAAFSAVGDGAVDLRLSFTKKQHLQQTENYAPRFSFMFHDVSCENCISYF